MADNQATAATARQEDVCGPCFMNCFICEKHISKCEQELTQIFRAKYKEVHIQNLEHSNTDLCKENTTLQAENDDLKIQKRGLVADLTKAYPILTTLTKDHGELSSAHERLKKVHRELKETTAWKIAELPDEKVAAINMADNQATAATARQEDVCGPCFMKCFIRENNILENSQELRAEVREISENPRAQEFCAKYKEVHFQKLEDRRTDLLEDNRTLKAENRDLEISLWSQKRSLEAELTKANPILTTLTKDHAELSSAHESLKKEHQELKETTAWEIRKLRDEKVMANHVHASDKARAELQTKLHVQEIADWSTSLGREKDLKEAIEDSCFSQLECMQHQLETSLAQIEQLQATEGQLRQEIGKLKAHVAEVGDGGEDL